MNLLGGEIFQSLRPFFEKNSNISEIAVEDGLFGAGSARQLSLALRCCNKSLTSIKIENNQMGGERLVEIIEALNTHSQLEKLRLIGTGIGITECVALADVLRHTIASELRTLYLRDNYIDDEGVDTLVGALTKSRLSVLSLSNNRDITGRGWRSLAAMLEHPNSNLEKLFLFDNNVGNEGALVFANALSTNCKLKTLTLLCNGITAEGWSGFSNVLCDPSSINNTFLSNHTLCSFGVVSTDLPHDVATSLTLNKTSNDKKQAAIKKILKHHQNFDMQPFFEWDLKVLPIAINWFERARSIDNNNEAGIDKHKLGAIYQFIRAMPEIFEPAPAAAGEKRKRSGN